MKILQINTYINGSTGKIAREINSFLGKNDSSIAYGKGINIHEIGYYKFNNNFWTKVDHFLSRITGLTCIFSNIPTNNLIKYIVKFNPDIIHLHNMHGYYVNMYKLIAFIKTNRINTVWTLHDEFMFTGNCGSAFPCEKWTSGCGNCPKIHEYPPSLFFDCSAHLLRRKKLLLEDFKDLVFVTPSLWLSRRVKNSILSSKKVVVIQNGINCKEIFYPRSFEGIKKKHNITTEKVVLAVAPGLFDGRKGGGYVLQLAKILKEKSIKFILIGANSKNIIEYDNIVLIPRTENQSELASYYSMADSLIICSKSENFPTVCLESLACGTPIVGFDTGGTAETTPGDLGIFVEYGNLEKLKNAILYMINNKDILKKRCVEYAQNNYSSEIMAKKYISLYQNILNERQD